MNWSSFALGVFPGLIIGLTIAAHAYFTTARMMGEIVRMLEGKA